ncbi:MAG: hypothetical protein HGA45_21555 [Chloroflexales bacterium]|nr:hypothetical protein [Chloroflexales bacterium]
MELHGLPDFATALATEGAQLFAPYGEQGPMLLTPGALAVAEAEAGGPDFLLETVRGRTPLLPPRPYAALDFRLRASYALAEALAVARQQIVGARVAPLALSGGALRLGGGAVPNDLRRRIPLAWNGLGLARCALRISIETAGLLIEGLRGAVLPIHAYADLVIIGVAPRLPHTVSFDPHALLVALAAAADSEGRMAYSALGAFFQRELGALPVSVGGAVAQDERTLLAESLIDHTLQRFGQIIAPPDDGAEPWVALAPGASLGAGRFTWDLAEPLLASRPLTLRLDPFAAARAVVDRRGIEAVTRATVVPSLPSGALAVMVTANLPAEREGVTALGVNLCAPARPPQRPQAALATALLEPPADSARVTLRLSPREPAAYTYTTFAVLADAGGAEEVRGEPTEHTGDLLELGGEQFPLDSIAVSAEPALLERALVRCTRRRPAAGGAGAPLEYSFALTLERPVRSLALPRGAAAGASLTVDAEEPGGAGRLRLGPLPAGDLCIDRFSFREYGPQRVMVEAALAPGAPSLLVELLPEGAPETPKAIGIVQLRPERPRQEWGYFAPSPFAPGYRYRLRRPTGEPPEPWSAARSPFEPLLIA